MRTEPSNGTQARRGVYPAPRASALSGVPLSTVYEWARGDNAVLVPSVSSSRVKLWSWSDLVALRAIYWLRHAKGEDRSATTLREVKRLIDDLERSVGRFGDALADRSIDLFVDRSGKTYVDTRAELKETLAWPQTVGRELVIGLLLPYSVDEHLRGPHLLTPRPNLRIIPGKLSGEPHVANTRIETRVLAALKRREMEDSEILELYPALTAQELQESLDLERQLEQNLTPAA